MTVCDLGCASSIVCAERFRTEVLHSGRAHSRLMDVGGHHPWVGRDTPYRGVMRAYLATAWTGRDWSSICSSGLSAVWRLFTFVIAAPPCLAGAAVTAGGWREA